MASIPVESVDWRAFVAGSLADPARSIGGPRFDAAFFWGAPLLASVLVWTWLLVALTLPAHLGQRAVSLLAYSVAVLTFAHLIAVAPRASLNRQDFEDNRTKLVAVPIALIAALLVSPVLLVCAAVLTVFWDVHHSAMQTFGLGRIYDMKSGNAPNVLRTTDLRLNWALYVGPIAAGFSLFTHVESFADFGRQSGSAPLVQIHNSDPRPGIDECAHILCAKPVGAARNDDCFTRKSVHGSSRLRSTATD